MRRCKGGNRKPSDYSDIDSYCWLHVEQVLRLKAHNLVQLRLY